MATETKIGLALIVLLVCAFGFVVYRKWEQHSAMASVVDTDQQEAVDEDDAADNDAADTTAPSQTEPSKLSDTADSTDSSDWQTFAAANSEPGATQDSDFNSTSSQHSNPSRADSGFGSTERPVARPSANDQDDPFFSDRGNSPAGTAHSEPAASSSEATEDPFEVGNRRESIDAVEAVVGSDDNPNGSRQTETRDAGEPSPFGAGIASQPRRQTAQGKVADTQTRRTQGLFDAASDDDLHGRSQTATDTGETAYGDSATGGADADSGYDNPRSHDFTEPASQADRYGEYRSATPDRADSSGSGSSRRSARDRGAAKIDSAGFGSQPTADAFTPAEDGSIGTRSPSGQGFGASRPVPSDGTTTYGSTTGAQPTRVYDDSAQRGLDRGTGYGSKTGVADAEFDNNHDRIGTNRSSGAVKVYAVRSGDNYWTISKKVYGTSRYFLALARANARRITDPNKMRPGMKVLIPQIADLKSNYPDLFPRAAADGRGTGVASRGKQKLPTGMFLGNQGAPLYRVGASDSLTMISQKHLGRASRWVQIYELNRHQLKSPNDLTIGTVLQLPADASRVRVIR